MRVPTLACAGLAALALLVAAACSESASGDGSGTPPPGTGRPDPGEIVTTADGVRFRVETVITDLQVPWSLAFAPDGRLFVTERPGRVLVAGSSPGAMEVALTLDDVFTQGEAGLLGLALDPGFAGNRFVYLYYTAASGSGPVNRLVRYREAGGRLGEAAVLLDGIPGASIHDGGRLRFGPDGLLYVTTGDAAAPGLAQDVASLAGKILRIRSDGSTPDGNRFGSPVYSYGHRNPQGLDWHPATGDLWASEHGSTGNDEINVIDGGRNYGWPEIQGAQQMTGMEPPVEFFSPAIAPSGVAFYRGQQFPAFAGNLFAATLRGAHLLRLVVDGGARTVLATERLLDGRLGRLRTVVGGPDGYLYVATNNRDGRGNAEAGDDRIVRLVPAP